MTTPALVEIGPIRPPSEAKSLLVRATRNCPWNRCAFCHTYRGERFSRRSVDEIIGDIDRMAALAREIREWSWRCGEGGRATKHVLRRLVEGGARVSDALHSVALWLHQGGESVFLQDANSLLMKTEDLLTVLGHIRRTFPAVRRITTYARSRTAARRSVEDLRRLAEAGLSRIHVGMESGSDRVLAFIHKGVTAEEHVEGGRRIRAAGISLCEYVMPGLGGQAWSEEHARETARVLQAIQPDFVRLRTLHVVPATDLARWTAEGRFQPLSDEEILREIRLLIFLSDKLETTLVSDHILNLLEELEGRLPQDRERLLAVIDRFFALPAEDRLIFRIGRRLGMYRFLEDLEDRDVHRRLRQFLAPFDGDARERLERDLTDRMHGYL